MPKATRKQISPNFDMSFLPTDQQIKDIQEAKKHHNGISIESVNDKKILEKQLCEFVVGVRRDDGEEYLSLKNCMAAIDRHLKSHSVIKDQITLNGNACKQNYPDLYKTLNGKLRDLKKQGKISTKKADTLSPDEIKQILNHPSTSKDTPEGLSRRELIWICLVFCPRGGEHTKMLKCQFDICDDMVVFTKFHQKNDQGGFDAINDDVWYLDHKIGTEKIKNYMKTICFDAVNHSGCATSLNWLYQSGVDDTQVMTISGHKSLKGVRSYIAPTIYQKASKISNVLQMALTLQESSTLNKTPQKNTGSDKHEPDDMSDKGSGVKSLGVSI
ncbi:17321_t:CDS:2 [Entrophospora sp. SA101]|nr:17321_t:CDS:2 [Entrophospora sp. SA101]